MPDQIEVAKARKIAQEATAKARRERTELAQREGQAEAAAPSVDVEKLRELMDQLERRWNPEEGADAAQCAGMRAGFNWIRQFLDSTPSVRQPAPELAPAASWRAASIGRVPSLGILFQHTCGHVEEFPASDLPTTGGCDACESGSDDPHDWQPLFRKVAIGAPGEDSQA